MTPTGWRNHAACRGHDPEIFFAGGGETLTAKRICRTCPVITNCLTDALNADPTLEGIWGGTDRSERRRIRRGTARPQPSPAVKREAMDLWRQVRGQYGSDHAVARAIARKLDVDDCTVLRWARDAKLAALPQVNIRTPEERAAAVDHYRRERPNYRTNTAAMDAVAEERGVSRAALRDWLRAEGVIAAEPRAPRNRREPKAEKASVPI